MTTPSSPRQRPELPGPFGTSDEAQLRPWLHLRNELTQLHARLEYLRLMVALGVHKIG